MEKYKQILNGEEPDAAEQRLTAAKDEATKAADNKNSFNSFSERF